MYAQAEALFLFPLHSQNSRVWSRTQMQPEMFHSPSKFPIQILKQVLLMERTERSFSKSEISSSLCIYTIFPLFPAMCFLSSPSGAGVGGTLFILFSTVALFVGGFPWHKSSIRRSCVNTFSSLWHLQQHDFWNFKLYHKGGRVLGGWALTDPHEVLSVC